VSGSLPPHREGGPQTAGWGGLSSPRSRALLGIGVLLASIIVLLWPGPLWPLALVALALGLLVLLGLAVALLLALLAARRRVP
jgi:hypothetical protein